MARLLALPEHGGHIVPVRTLQQWVRSEKWHTRLLDTARTSAPAMLERDAAALAALRGTAVRYLGRVIAGLEDSPDLERLAASIAEVPANQRAGAIRATIKEHAEARKARLAACLLILDRTGCPPGRAALSRRLP